MLSSGNAEPQTCVNNLIKTWRKEAFYGRRKGIPTNLEDMPFSTAADQLSADTEEMLEEFEERVDVNEVTVIYDESGEAVITADVDISNEYLDEDDDEEDDDEQY